ncbi:MAG: CvpA family protein [Mangrovibacterium sp.]
MNYIDIILGILLVIAAFRGFSKGFIVELASLAALVLGVWGAIHFSHFTAGYIRETFDYQPEHLGLIAFFITFILIVVVVHILGNALDHLAQALALGFINHLAGLLFGIVKTAVILSILLVIFDQVDERSHLIPQEDKEASRVYEPLKSLVPTLLPFLNFWDEAGLPLKENRSDETEKVA